MEARHKTLDFIGRNACRRSSQANSQFKHILHYVNNFLMWGCWVMINSCKPVLTHF
jgi:hypothetical protein